MANPVWVTQSGSVGAWGAGTPMSFQFNARLNQGWSVTYSLLSGTLPTGLSLSSAGLMSGIPQTINEVTTSTFTIRATALTRSGAIIDQTDRTFDVSITTWSAPAAGSLGNFTGGTSIHPITFVAGAGIGGNITYRLVPGTSYPAGSFTLNPSVNNNGVKVAVLTGTPNTVSQTTSSQLTIAAIKTVIIDGNQANIAVNRTFSMTVLPYTNPQWVTPAGNIGNYVENDSFTYQFQANAVVNGDIVTYSLLNGSYPTGNLTLQNTANIAILTGTLGKVNANTVSEFTIRASEKNGNTVVGVADRTFNMTVSGATPPTFQTPPGIIGDMSSLPYANSPSVPINSITVDSANSNQVVIGISPYNLTNYGLTNNTAVYIGGVSGMTQLNNNLYYIGNADSGNSKITLYLNPGANNQPTNQLNGATYSAYTGNGSIARVRPDSTYFSAQLVANVQDPNTTAFFSLAAGSLPDGLELSANGTISGYPTGVRLEELSDGGGFQYYGAVDIYGQPIIKLSEFTLKVTSASGNSTANYAIGICNQEAQWEFNKQIEPANYGNFPGRPPVLLNNEPMTQILNKTDPYYTYYFSGNTLGTFQQNNQLLFKMIGYNFNATQQQGNEYGLQYTITGLSAGTPDNSNAFSTGNLVSPLANGSAGDGWINGTLGNIGTDINTYTFNVNITAPNLAGNVTTLATFTNGNSRVLVGNIAGLRTSQTVEFIGNSTSGYSNATTYTIASANSIVTTAANITDGVANLDPNISVGSLLALTTNTPITFTGDNIGNIQSNTTYYIASFAQNIIKTANIATGSNLITVNTYGISNGTPVTFDTTTGNIMGNTVYYARRIAGDDGNIRIRPSNSSPYITANVTATNLGASANSPMITISSAVGGANIIPDGDTNMTLTANANNITLTPVVVADLNGNMTLTTSDLLPINGGTSSYSFIVSGDINAGIVWGSTGDLGTINNGGVSNKSVKAIFGSDSVSTTVTITAGNANIAAQSVKALSNNQPVTFTGNSVGNISNNAVYFINGPANTTSSTVQLRTQYEATNSVTPSASGTMTLRSKINDGKFKIIDGTLPPNLKLLTTGDIVGRVAFESTDVQQTANAIKTYTFTVEAYSKQYVEIKQQKTFTLTTVQRFTDPYDNLYVKGLIKVEQRALVDDLLLYIDSTQNNTLTKNIYRPDDANFGISTGVEYGHMYGVNAKTSDVFVEAYRVAIEKNHYYKDLTLGSLRTAVARDNTGAIVYEVVYSPIIDNLVNQQGVSISKEIGWPYAIIIDGIQQSGNLYPNSLPNMITQIEQTIGGINDDIVLPTWMRSQQTDGNVPGFISCWVLCYTQPGKSTEVLNSINTYLTDNAFSLNSINFAMDRFEVDRSLTYTYGTQLNQYWPTFTADLVGGDSNIYLDDTSGLQLNQTVQFSGNSIGNVSNVANYYISDLDKTTNTIKIRDSYYGNVAVPVASAIVTPSLSGSMTLVVTPLSASVADDSQDSYVYFTQKTILK